jgi:hypothetical protein
VPKGAGVFHCGNGGDIPRGHDRTARTGKTEGSRMTEVRVQVLGICRFSLLVEGGFQVGGPRTLAQRRVDLYDAVRLAHRFAWFEHVFLPAIRAQTDPDFTMVVVTGEDFPAPWFARLEALTAPVRQIVLDRRAPKRHRRLMREVIRDHVESEADVVAQFRLDDDDAVAIDYVARIREDHAMLAPLFARTRLMAVDHARGIVLARDGATLVPAPRLSANWGCGLTLYMLADHPQCVFDYTHFRVWEWMPSVSLNDTEMYVRGWHGDNDSPKLGPQRPYDLTPDQIDRVLRERFLIDVPGFEAALAALPGKSTKP